MIENEIKTLKEYIKKGKEEISSEKKRIDLEVEAEAMDFFSKYPTEVDASIVEEYKNSLKSIRLEKLDRMKSAVNTLNSKLDDIEKEYANSSF